MNGRHIAEMIYFSVGDIHAYRKLIKLNSQFRSLQRNFNSLSDPSSSDYERRGERKEN